MNEEMKSTLQAFGELLSGNERIVWDAAVSAVDPEKGKYVSLSKEDLKLLKEKGISEEVIDDIEAGLNTALIDAVEKALAPEYKRVLDAVRHGVKVNSTGYYTVDIKYPYAALGQQLGMDADAVEVALWQLHLMKIIYCFSAVVRDKSGVRVDSYDVRPWEAKSRGPKEREGRL